MVFFGSLDGALQRAGGGAGAEALAEEEARREERAGRVGDAEAGDLVRVDDVGGEKAGAGLAQPGAGDGVEAAGEVGGGVDDRAGEVPAGDDEVDRAPMVAE